MQWKKNKNGPGFIFKCWCSRTNWWCFLWLLAALLFWININYYGQWWLFFHFERWCLFIYHCQCRRKILEMNVSSFFSHSKWCVAFCARWLAFSLFITVIFTCFIYITIEFICLNVECLIWTGWFGWLLACVCNLKIHTHFCTRTFLPKKPILTDNFFSSPVWWVIDVAFDVL